ncbi:MAG TPA: peroxiredoxin [Bacteroidota bacterium]|jgi:peroxiredoxin|nr:peroxiredoxin [Bacteroidota bacterium]
MKRILILACLAVLATGYLSGQEHPPVHQLAVGDPAPDFTLPYATKDSVASDDLKLSSEIGKSVIVLAFYPADWSGGCTKEMCTMRDNIADLSHLNAEVLGISGDYEYSHHEWAKNLNLPVKLVSDHSHAVAKTYSSYNDARGYNKRTVYVIDKKGKIAYIDLSYSSRDMESFNKLKAALSALQ